MVDEVALAFVHGLFGRREALRRLMCLGVGIPAATAILASCRGDDDAEPTPPLASEMRVRRVVTGHDGEGSAVFVRDDFVPPTTVLLAPGAAFHQVWGGDEAPRFPDGGSRPEPTTYYPPVGGFRFVLVTFPPGDGGEVPDDVDMTNALAEVEAKLPGLTAYVEPDGDGMHTTATIDLEIVLRGEITLELDNGETRTMGVGDTIVQNGTRHRWLNPGTEAALLAVFSVGAHHDHVD